MMFSLVNMQTRWAALWTSCEWLQNPNLPWTPNAQANGSKTGPALGRWSYHTDGLLANEMGSSEKPDMPWGTTERLKGHPGERRPSADNECAGTLSCILQSLRTMEETSSVSNIYILLWHSQVRKDTWISWDPQESVCQLTHPLFFSTFI